MYRLVDALLIGNQHLHRNDWEKVCASAPIGRSLLLAQHGCSVSAVLRSDSRMLFAIPRLECNTSYVLMRCVKFSDILGSSRSVKGVICLIAYNDNSGILAVVTDQSLHVFLNGKSVDGKLLLLLCTLYITVSSHICIIELIKFVFWQQLTTLAISQ